MLAGVDLDSCRREDGTLDPWADAIIEQLATYAEISPSGQGAKLFFRVSIADFNAIKDLLNIAKTGRQFKKPGGGDHPPGFEIYFLGRYFAVTERHLPGTPRQLATVGVDDLRWLLTEAGPALAGKGSAQRGAERGDGPNDQSRSGAAFRLGLRMRRAGKSYEEFCEACRTSPNSAIADWCADKGMANGERELENIWKNAAKLLEGDKPQLIVHGGDLPATAYALRDLFIESSILFDRGRVLSRLIADAEGAMYCQKLTVSNIVMAAHELCQPVKFDREGNLVPVTLPDAVARMYLEMSEWRLRPLAGITTAPIMRADGSVVTERSYDAVTQMFADAPPVVELPGRPTEQQARMALRRLRHAFETFPFADAVLRQKDDLFIVDHGQPPGLFESGYLAAVLTAVARPSLWTAPGVLITAPHISGAGAGKGLLARAAALIAYGVPPVAFTFGHDKDEFDKRLVTALLSGAPTVFIDNVNGQLLRSETLASALTERPAQVRILGSSAMLPLNAVTFVVVTGNGLKVTEDLARRILWVDVDPQVEDPEERPFKPGFLKMIAEQRGSLLNAALTILRFGRGNAGQVSRGMPSGSFEQWCEWVRDPLLALGCRDPIEATRQAKQADPMRRELAELFGTWNRAHRDEPVAARDLDDAILAIINPQKRARQFVTRALQRMVGTRHAGFVLTESRGGKYSPPTFALQRQRHGALETP
jgi:hypothetical protein